MTPTDILKTLGVPERRSKKELALLIGAPPAALSRVPDGGVTWRVLGLAADLLLGEVSPSSATVQGTAWTRAENLVREIRRVAARDALDALQGRQ